VSRPQRCSLHAAARNRNRKRAVVAVSKAAVGKANRREYRNARSAWQIPRGITEGLPEAKQNTGRPALAGAIVTASGVLFVGSTDDNRSRAFEAKTGKQLWVTQLDRRANANSITYQGRDGKQYVAIVATDTLHVFALP
jgi:glucose dehydrogenase